MSGIKVGDYVVRLPNAEGSSAWARFLRSSKGKGLTEKYLVTKVEGIWLQIEDWINSNGDVFPFQITNFEVVEGLIAEQPCVDDTATVSDVVNNPAHYQFFPHVEAIEIIAMSLSEEGFHGYCLGNRLKYRLRAGKKDDALQELSKSDFYIELFNKHKHLCRG